MIIQNADFFWIPKYNVGYPYMDDYNLSTMTMKNLE